MGLLVKDTLPRIRKARGLTQKQLGEKSRIAREDIVAFETGTKTVGAARLQRLADALEVSPVELGAPVSEDDPVGQLLHHRQDALEAEVRRLTAQARRLGGQVRALERRLRSAGIG